MCGIVAIYECNKDRAIRPGLLKEMTDQLVHRGPDEEGYFETSDVQLGARRLSIVDLANGHQPMYNEDRSVVMVCNGEIYNYKSLLRELTAKGHNFKTNCDIEVIIHLYEEYGVDFLNMLNGQFAFALYDTRRHQLFAARDHVGIAPLFYTRQGSRYIFASEIKSIITDRSIARKVNLESLDQFFSFPSVVSPLTMFEGINSLKPGHFILVSCNGELLQEYWDIDYPLHTDEVSHPERYYVEKLEHLLLQSVSYRLHADVPVGLYLSGGLDSSLICSLANKLFPDVRRHSFSINFDDNSIDEGRYQDMIVKQIGSIHHSSRFNTDDICRHLKKVIYHSETPLRESYNTCSLALSSLVREKNIKVVLSGEGADELFAGYVGYKFDTRRNGTTHELSDYDEICEREIRKDIWGDADFFYDRNYFNHEETRRAVYSEPISTRFQEFKCTKYGIVDVRKLHGRHRIHKRSYVDFKLRVSDHLVADHGDRVGYANSVEARYPFLDVELMDFVKTIPPSLKLNGMNEKYILKKCAENILPDEIIKREKFSFVAPGSPHLLRLKNPWVDDMLSYNRISRQGYFNPDTIERIKKMYLAKSFDLNQTFEDDLLMMVLTFNIFLDVFEIENFA